MNRSPEIRAALDRSWALVKRHGPTATSYGVPTILLLTIVAKICWATIFGVDPAPQSPPFGYLAHEDLVNLQWRRGEATGPLTVEVAKGRNFDKLVFKKTTGHSRIQLPPLDRDHEYCWRLRSADKTSPYSCFRTARGVFNY